MRTSSLLAAATALFALLPAAAQGCGSDVQVVSSSSSSASGAAGSSASRGAAGTGTVSTLLHSGCSP